MACDKQAGRTLSLGRDRRREAGFLSYTPRDLDSPGSSLTGFRSRWAKKPVGVQVPPSASADSRVRGPGLVQSLGPWCREARLGPSASEPTLIEWLAARVILSWWPVSSIVGTCIKILAHRQIWPLTVR